MSFLNYLASRWDHLLELSIAHAEVVFISLLIATAIGVTTGVLVYRRERTAEGGLSGGCGERCGFSHTCGDGGTEEGGGGVRLDEGKRGKSTGMENGGQPH